MPQSLAKVIVHIVYSTKNREPWLEDKNLRTELFAYNASILSSSVDCPVIMIDGVEDHIHILCLLSRKFSIMDVIKKSKTATSKWLKRQGLELGSELRRPRVTPRSFLALLHPGLTSGHPFGVETITRPPRPRVAALAESAVS